MKRNKQLCLVIYVVTVLVLIPQPVHAYIDPGTIGNVFGFLGPIIALALGFLGFMIRPIRNFFTSIFTRTTDDIDNELAESCEKPVSENPTDEGNL